MIRLDKVIHYSPILFKLHNVLVKCDAFLKRMTNHLMIPTIFWVVVLAFSLGYFGYGNLTIPFSKRLLRIPSMCESGNGSSPKALLLWDVSLLHP